VTAKTEAGRKTGGKKTSPERRALIMWALLACESAAAFQKELKPEPLKADREALDEAGLISSWKVGQKIWIEVTDKGWAWAGENLGHALPAQSTAGAEILRRWLVKLDAYLNAHGLALAEVLGPQTSAPGSGANGHHKAPIESPAGSLRNRIRAAYLEATGGRFNTRALLRDIRIRLADVERGTLDEALKAMQREDDAVLYPLDNRAEITDADRAAAIPFADEPRHILWIER
jgi:hypothetical protein